MAFYAKIQGGRRSNRQPSLGDDRRGGINHVDRHRAKMDERRGAATPQRTDPRERDAIWRKDGKWK